MLPNIGIKLEESVRRNGKTKQFLISSHASEEDLMNLKNYGQPFHEHGTRCKTKCTAEHKPGAFSLPYPKYYRG